MLLSLLVLFCDWCYCHLLFVIDVIITFCCFSLIGRCYAMWCGTTFLLQEGIDHAHGWCYCHFVLLGWCYCLCYKLADVIAIFVLLGWCYCLCFRLADVIASGWCYCHICSRLVLLPWWLMLYPPMGEMADVTDFKIFWSNNICHLTHGWI